MATLIDYTLIALDLKESCQCTKQEHVQLSDGSCWEIIIIKQIHTFTSNVLFEQRRFGRVAPAIIKSVFDLVKARATQTETSLLKHYVAGERVDLLDEHVQLLSD